MSTLKLSYTAMLDEVGNNAIVLDVMKVNDPENSTGKGHLEMVRENLILSGDWDRSEHIHLEDGHYLVRARLPNGEVFTQDVELGAEDETVEIRSEAQSPHDWMMWHAFQGSVDYRTDERRSQLQDRKMMSNAARQFGGKRATQQSWVEPFAEDSGLLERVDSVEVFTLEPSASPLGTGGKTWATLQRVISSNTGSQAMDISGHPIEPEIQDERYELYRFESEYGDLGSRRFVVVKSNSGERMVSLPVPWPQVDHSGEAPCELVVEKGGTGEVGISVAIRDRLVGSALAYLTSGDIAASAHLFESARMMLFEKMSNPLGAAAGAYVMLSDNPESGPWQDWIYNLMNWMEWLPDGAIQYAWLKTHLAESDDDLDKAREALKKAGARGVPYFSLGLSWLRDLLVLHAGEDDSGELAELLKQVQTTAWRTDMQQTFTTIDLRRERIVERTPERVSVG